MWPIGIRPQSLDGEQHGKLGVVGDQRLGLCRKRPRCRDRGVLLCDLLLLDGGGPLCLGLCALRVGFVGASQGQQRGDHRTNGQNGQGDERKPPDSHRLSMLANILADEFVLIDAVQRRSDLCNRLSPSRVPEVELRLVVGPADVDVPRFGGERPRQSRWNRIGVGGEGAGTGIPGERARRQHRQDPARSIRSAVEPSRHLLVDPVRLRRLR